MTRPPTPPASPLIRRLAVHKRNSKIPISLYRSFVVMLDEIKEKEVEMHCYFNTSKAHRFKDFEGGISKDGKLCQTWNLKQNHQMVHEEDEWVHAKNVREPNQARYFDVQVIRRKQIKRDIMML
ncbi:hypothetical protein L1987_48455 [Smallanthus sonchifolius]|uniref:Uncharacterized protein n=1 Tax=Smallanthus sonchifolius TaxID=185202 RepID=A0ACB9FSG7_9ASTR|nr:hypothetical protein L1987_48455 [Smallanthus sonchifolius]